MRRAGAAAASVGALAGLIVLGRWATQDSPAPQGTVGSLGVTLEPATARVRSGEDLPAPPKRLTAATARGSVATERAHAGATAPAVGVTGATDAEALVGTSTFTASTTRTLGAAPPDTDPRAGQTGRGPATLRGEVPPDSNPFGAGQPGVWALRPRTATSASAPPDTDPFNRGWRAVDDAAPATARGEVAPDRAARVKGAHAVSDPTPLTGQPDAPIPPDSPP